MAPENLFSQPPFLIAFLIPTVNHSRLFRSAELGFLTCWVQQLDHCFGLDDLRLKCCSLRRAETE
jgi:hypothetical protein